MVRQAVQIAQGGGRQRHAGLDGADGVALGPAADGAGQMQMGRQGRAARQDEAVERLETEIDEINDALKPLDSFILPGGSPLSTHLHLARTVCRRAEREAVRLVESGQTVTPEAVIYLNRLSDLLFVAGRRANANGADDVLWKPGATR